MKKVFSFDAETDGLWGKPFSVAAIVYELLPTIYGDAINGNNGDRGYKWKETARFIAKMPTDKINNQWVVENVLPALSSIEQTHETYEHMLKDFAAFYMLHKQGADCICHMGYIVEAHLLREMHRLGFIGDWDAPYPLIDISGNLNQINQDATSVDAFAKKYELDMSDYGSTHNPLYDCEVAAKVYIHLKDISA